MFSRSRQIFATGLFLLDGAIIAASWVGAYWLRFHALGLATPLGVPPLEFYLWVGAVITPVALIVLRTFRIYRSARTTRLSQELIALAQGMIVVTALAGLGSFFTRGELARSVLLIFGVVATALLWVSRIAIRLWLRGLRRRGHNLRHVAIVGTGPLAVDLARKMERHADYGLVIRGFIRSSGDAAEVAGYPVFATIDDLPGAVEQAGIEIVYMALPRAEIEAEAVALDRLADSTAAVRLVPDLAHAYTLNASVEDFDGTPVLLVTESPEQGWNAVLKRGFDVVASAIGLIVLAPVFAAIALWVKLDSPGPIFYGQERVGFSGRRFHMIKFRTMRTDAEARGPGWTTANDPRRTRAGAVLRRLSLDELPQLWNVLLGQMSLVGPRPEQPAFVEQFRSSIPRYMLRHHVKAGLTGWAQVNGLRGDTPLEQRIEFDLYYLQHWSLAFDLRILALTLVRVFRDASAY